MGEVARDDLRAMEKEMGLQSPRGEEGDRRPSPSSDSARHRADRREE